MPVSKGSGPVPAPVTPRTRSLRAFRGPRRNPSDQNGPMFESCLAAVVVILSARLGYRSVVKSMYASRDTKLRPRNDVKMGCFSVSDFAP